MDIIAPRGPVQVCGTNTGRYLSVSAALAVIEHLADGAVFRYVAALESQLKKVLGMFSTSTEYPVISTVMADGSAFTLAQMSALGQ
ncbi:hypothetical protein D9M71_833270 [compost metagenome]